MSDSQPTTTLSEEQLERLAAISRTPSPEGLDTTPGAIAKRFYDAYEELASAFGYQNVHSAIPWEELTINYQDLMVASVRGALMEAGCRVLSSTELASLIAEVRRLRGENEELEAMNMELSAKLAGNERVISPVIEQQEQIEYKPGDIVQRTVQGHGFSVGELGKITSAAEHHAQWWVKTPSDERAFVWLESEMEPISKSSNPDLVPETEEQT